MEQLNILMSLTQCLVMPTLPHGLPMAKSNRIPRGISVWQSDSPKHREQAGVELVSFRMPATHGLIPAGQSAGVATTENEAVTDAVFLFTDDPPAARVYVWALGHQNFVERTVDGSPFVGPIRGIPFNDFPNDEMMFSHLK